ncbi:MAG: hypothetical protein V4465_02950 [Patescibacteria group bacterium]
MRISILLVLLLAACSRAVVEPTTAASVGPSLEMAFNGQRGTKALMTEGNAFTFGWVSARAIACEMVTPVHSGLTLSGQSDTVAPGHLFYPAKGKSVTLTVTCTDGVVVVRDSVLAYAKP